MGKLDQRLALPRQGLFRQGVSRETLPQRKANKPATGKVKTMADVLRRAQERSKG